MSKPAEQRVAIVTGGASGIGRACVTRLLRDGVRVVFTDVAVTAGRQTLEALDGHRGRVKFVPGDVRDPAHHARTVAEALSWGRIDVLVACAGVQTSGRLIDTEMSDFQTVIDINLKGVAQACIAVLPSMTACRSGAIVLISSINALLGFPAMAAYDASKAGVIALARHIAVEHGRDNVRANAICPGATVTDFHLKRAAAQGMDGDQLRASLQGYGLLGRAAEPEDIAASVAFLAGPEAAFITGQTLLVDGGVSIMGARARA